MILSDWLIILAILLAPLLAVQVQKYTERFRERRKRKLNVFFTLMATRSFAERLSPEHVKALNRIDIEFYGYKIFGFTFQTKSEKAVIEKWKSYLDHLNTAFSQERFQNWVGESDQLLVKLLYEMAQSLGYHFDEVTLKKGIYAPKAHLEQELNTRIIREKLAKILCGKGEIPILVRPPPQS